MKKDFHKYHIGLETGGTNIKCMIARDPADVLSMFRIRTGNPDESVRQVINFITSEIKKHSISIESMGIASFGPVNLNRSTAEYGSITSTPKLAWRNYPLLAKFTSIFDFPIAFDTDVNAATLGESRWGAGKGLTDFIYVTIGTGIGGGIITNNRLVHGVVHPEIGHMLINHDRNLDPFEGTCPYHKDCLEGLANGPSIAARWGMPAENIPPEHQAWNLEAFYLAQMVVNLTLTLSPQRIILGGGVSQKSGLVEAVRSNFTELLHLYIRSPLFEENLESYITTAMLGQDAGIFGAIALAQNI
jgi:fructokinase